VQKVEFADAATYPFADTIFNLYKGKFLRAVSVGFMPLEMPNRITDLEGNATGGYEFTSQELLELSAVPIPANPEALAPAACKKVSPRRDLSRVFAPALTPDAVYPRVGGDQPRDRARRGGSGAGDASQGGLGARAAEDCSSSARIERLPHDRRGAGRDQPRRRSREVGL